MLEVEALIRAAVRVVVQTDAVQLPRVIEVDELTGIAKLIHDDVLVDRHTVLEVAPSDEVVALADHALAVQLTLAELEAKESLAADVIGCVGAVADAHLEI